ncbi:MAG: DUF2279 domain-containing protein [Flavitalea sp.]
MVKRIIILLCVLLFIEAVKSQEDSIHRINRQRLLIVAGGNAALWGTSYIVLNKTWYAGYARTKFHFFDDLPEWNQMDKAGHIWTSYHVSRLSAQMWKWTGFNNNSSAILGGASGLLYQGIIELQDAYSSQWGFSVSDIGANVVGSGWYVFQQIAWKDQRIQIKLSTHPNEYPGSLLYRRNQLFGNTALERILKDYNSQTYWASANLKSFFPVSNIPSWLNFAVGYGSEGMYGGRNNIWTDKEGVSYDYNNIRRVRKFYLAPDIDLTKIRVKSKLLRSVFFVLNMVKIPAPALELKGGKLNVKAFKF